MAPIISNPPSRRPSPLLRRLAVLVAPAALAAPVAIVAPTALAAPTAIAAPAAHAVPTWADYSRNVSAEGLVDRFLEATKAMIDTPYENGPLGEGPGAAVDSDPRVDFGRVDCVTYLEQALALAVTPSHPRSLPDAARTAPSATPTATPTVNPGVTSTAPSLFQKNLDAVRYMRGQVSYPQRNHYMVTDWIPANDWLLEDVTTDVAADHAKTITRTIDRGKFLRDHGVDVRPGQDEARPRPLSYVPIGALPQVEGAIRSGDLIFWVGKAEGIFVVHTGLAVREATGRLLHRHGSSRAGKVVEESFADYANGATFALGFLVLRLRDDAPARLAASRQGESGSAASGSAASDSAESQSAVSRAVASGKSIAGGDTE